MEEPEDGEQRTSPSYLYSSLIGVQASELLLVEVEVINMWLDQELSSEACPGEKSGGDDVVRKQNEEEERKRQEEEQRQRDEEEQQWREEEREQEENSRREEHEATQGEPRTNHHTRGL